MQTNHLDDDASDASWALLELKNSSARVLPITLDPVSVVTGLPRGIYTSTTMSDSSMGRISTGREHARDPNANGEQQLACFEIGVNKYIMRKELFQIGRNSSKGNVDIDLTQTDNTATGFVSRIHCEVRYDARSNKFNLSCFGKNGVFVDDIFQRRDDVDDPLQLRPSCVLTFPSTHISIRFTSLIPDPDQSPIRNVAVPAPTRTCTYTSPNKHEGESRLPNGQKANNGIGSVSASVDVCADCSSANCRCNRAGRHRSVHIPESDTPIVDATHDCDIDVSQRTVSVVSLHHSHSGFCATLHGDSGSPQTPSPLQPLSTSLPHSLFSLAKGDGRQSSASAQAVFRQPNNGSAKSGRHISTATHLPTPTLTPTPTQTNGEHGDRGPKPPYSYAQLIAQAIANAPQRQLTLSGIYAFITKNYPYFHANDKGWQNSIRHNLSLNRFFMKVPRSHEEPGKGMFWRIEAEYEDKLITTAYRKRRQRSANSGPDASGTPRRIARSKGRSNASAPEIGLRDSNSSNGKASMLSHSAARQNVCESAPDSPCSPVGGKSPPALTATLTASLSASACSSRNTSPTCDNELLGVVQPFALDTGVFTLGVSKSISLPHSPVTTFLIDELKQRSVDVVHSSENDSRQTASARSTPVFSIAPKQPLTLPTFTAQSPVIGADKQQQQLALFIQASPGRHCALPNGRTVQPDMLTPPNSASSSNSNCRNSSCTSETHSKCDPLAYMSEKPRHSEPTACCAKPAILVDTQLHSYLQQQSGLTHPTNAFLTRQYSSPAKSSEHMLDGTALLHGLAHGKRPMENGNGSNCTDRLVTNNCFSLSQSSAMRANGHAVPLKKRCYFKAEVEQSGQQ